MEAMNYTSIGPVLQLNKAGELTQKRMKAVKVCDGLYISEPDKNGYMQFICELNDVIWLDCKAAETKIAYGIKRIPSYFKDIKAGCFDGKNIEKFRREISRRINRPDSPVIMELKKPERKKPAPLAENERKVSVLMLKGRTDEITEKRVVIAEVVPHVYTYTYKLKRYGERVKIIFEIDGVYFQGHDTGANVLEREDFTEVCTKAYRLARKNVADGAASGMQYFIEVQKRMDAATPTETPQISTEAAETVNVSAEEGNEAIKHISEIMETCRTWDDEKRDYTDEYKYYTWLANHIPEHENTNKNVTEIVLEEARERIATAATLVAHGVPKCDMEGAVCAVVNRLAKMEDILRFYDAIEPPQSPEAPQIAECIADTPKPRETARKRPNRAIGSAQHHQCPALGANGYAVLNDASATLTAMSVPRECSTADYW